MIEWKNARKNGVVAKGTQKVSNTDVEWNITRSAGRLAYQLHLGDVKLVAMVTRGTINDCKLYAEAYFS